MAIQDTNVSEDEFEAVPAPPMAAIRRPKFEFADGLRAIAAITVAAYHAMMFTGYLYAAREDLPIVWRLLQVGNYAVPVFIVLSGFVLMLPVARSDTFELRGGMMKYIGRRAKRILPPYYASLLIFIAMIATIPVLQVQSGTAWDNKIPVTVEGVVSHLLVVHNLWPSWIYQINGPAWSIATEWQIYFLLPLMLLPLWRRIGPWWTVAIAAVLGLGIGEFVSFLRPAHYWFIGLFAMGMLAAHLAVRGTRLRAGWPAAAIVGAAIAWLYIDPVGAERNAMWSETLIGIGIALTLLWLAAGSTAGKRSWLHKMLETRLLIWVGLWSFSLYLVHSPLLALANLLLLPLSLPTWAQFLVMILVALPIAAAAGYLFHLLVERHFITSHQAAELAKTRTSRLPWRKRAATK